MSSPALARGRSGPGVYARTRPDPEQQKLDDLITDGDVSPRAVRLYLWIKRIWEPRHPGRYPTRGEMALAVGCSKGQVDRELSQLVERNYLGKTFRVAGSRDSTVAYTSVTRPRLAPAPMVEEVRPLFDVGSEADGQCAPARTVVSAGAHYSQHGRELYSAPARTPLGSPLKDGVLEPSPNPEGGAGGFDQGEQSEPENAQAEVIAHLTTLALKRFPNDQDIAGGVRRLFAQYPFVAALAAEFAIAYKRSGGFGLAFEKAKQWTAPGFDKAVMDAELASIRPKAAPPLPSPGSGPKPDLTDRSPTAKEVDDVEKAASAGRGCENAWAVEASLRKWVARGWYPRSRADELLRGMGRPPTPTENKPAAGSSAKLPPRPAQSDVSRPNPSLNVSSGQGLQPGVHQHRSVQSDRVSKLCAHIQAISGPDFASDGVPVPPGSP